MLIMFGPRCGKFTEEMSFWEAIFQSFPSILWNFTRILLYETLGDDILTVEGRWVKKMRWKRESFPGVKEGSGVESALRG